MFIFCDFWENLIFKIVAQSTVHDSTVDVNQGSLRKQQSIVLFLENLDQKRHINKYLFRCSTPCIQHFLLECKMLLVNNCNPVRFPFDGYLNVYEAEPSWQVSSSQGSSINYVQFEFTLGLLLVYFQLTLGFLRLSQVFSCLLGILMITRQRQAGSLQQSG